MISTHRFFVTAPRELADLLAEELRQLGLADPKIARTGVYVEGSLEAAYRICLWSRIANRVLMPLTEYPAANSDQLYAGAMEVDWPDHFDCESTIAVDAHVASSAINHSQFAAQRIKDAVADRFRQLTGDRPSVNTTTPDIRINGYIRNDRAQLYLDLAGDSLHLRGYRTEGGSAPLKENLAAAMLMRAQWPQLAAEGHPFIDFMCGSGTLLIEAAMMAFDIAPGLLRERHGFLKWHHHDAELWNGLVAEATLRREQGLVRRLTIRGYDKESRAVEMAARNVANAGLEAYVAVERQEIAAFRAKLPAPGLVVINPPYGKRIGREEELPQLYREIGDLLRSKFNHWQVALLTDSPPLGKEVGIRTRRIHALYNGAIKCSLLHFDVEESNFFERSGLPTALDTSELSENALMFRNRIIKNRRRLKSWVKREDVGCYRLYDADLPDYAVAVDLYDSTELFVHVQEYEAPVTVDRRRAQRRLREIVTILLEVFETDPAHLYLKRRRRQRGSAQYERLATTGQYHEVNEGGLRFLVNFDEHLDTGLFLDHRPMRQRILGECAGKSFLNLFAYTGSMTVAAAAGGATRTTSVDLSARYLEWAKQNMQRNGFDLSTNQFVHADCMQWLKGRDPERFDLIFLDPPTFSNSARMESHFDVQADQEELIGMAMGRLSQEGKLYFSVNARRFKLAPAIGERFSVTDITRETIAPDFARRPNIHRCWIIAPKEV